MGNLLGGFLSVRIKEHLCVRLKISGFKGELISDLGLHELLFPLSTS